MRHRVGMKKLGRPTGHRLALIRNLMTDLLRHGHLQTTEPKANELRRDVEKHIATALGKALGHPARVIAAGRTDAGVHADGQVVSFDTTSTITATGLRRVLPRWLPDDVWLVDLADVSSDFDARRSVARRWYRYAI